MNEKGSSKVLGIIFVVVVVVLLFAHYTSVNQIKSDYDKQLVELKTEMTGLEKIAEANLTKAKILEIKLQLNEINLAVSRNDYGTASLKLKKFSDELSKGGCKKLDTLVPLFNAIDTKLLKLDKTVVTELKEVEKIIFSKPVEQKEEAKVEENKG